MASLGGVPSTTTVGGTGPSIRMTGKDGTMRIIMPSFKYSDALVADLYFDWWNKARSCANLKMPEVAPFIEERWFPVGQRKVSICYENNTTIT